MPCCESAGCRRQERTAPARSDGARRDPHVRRRRRRAVADRPGPFHATHGAAEQKKKSDDPGRGEQQRGGVATPSKENPKNRQSTAPYHACSTRLAPSTAGSAGASCRAYGWRRHTTNRRSGGSRHESRWRRPPPRRRSRSARSRRHRSAACPSPGSQEGSDHPQQEREPASTPGTTGPAARVASPRRLLEESADRHPEREVRERDHQHSERPGFGVGRAERRPHQSRRKGGYRAGVPAWRVGTREVAGEALGMAETRSFLAGAARAPSAR